MATRRQKVVLDNYSDEELVALCTNDDRQALTLLLQRVQPKTDALIQRHVESYADALDIAQEVLIKIYKSITSFRHQASFQTWHYRIVMNAIHSYFRASNYHIFKNAVNFEDFDELHPQITYNDPQAELISQETIKRLLRVLNTMPEILGEAFRLYELEGLTYDEIAKTLECPVGTVRSRIARARNLIDEKLYNRSG